MEKLIKAIKQKLSNDPELSEIVSAVRYWRQPREPKKLIKPVVVFAVRDMSDKSGGHGMNSSPIMEFDIWAYDQHEGQIIQATLAADRIINLLVTSRLEVPNGGTTRVSVASGFQSVNEQDPNTIHLHGRFSTSYWDASRIDN